MTISILSLFPEMFVSVFASSIISRAQKSGRVSLRYINIRDFASDKHKSVDDKPYGGGVGMILRVDIVHKAIQSSRIPSCRKDAERVVLLDPTGIVFTQSLARRYSRLSHLVLVCGHYEGIDGRIQYFVDEHVSLGDFILTGGEIPAMAITDAVCRLVRGVLSKEDATRFESFATPEYIESSQFTRPREFLGFRVPEALLSGNHASIIQWKDRDATSRRKTRKRMNS